jgi:hypothetical protein
MRKARTGKPHDREACAGATLVPYEEVRRLPRCCDGHPDLFTLCRHLVDQYPDVDPGWVAHEVSVSKNAVEFVALDSDGLLMVELTARARLEVLSGRREEVARVDPQPHPNRRSRTRTGRAARA